MDATSRIQEEKELVFYQLLASDPDLNLSIGDEGSIKTYTRDQLLQHVKSLDEIGQDYIDTQMKFMRAVGSGEIHELIQTVGTL